MLNPQVIQIKNLVNKVFAKEFVYLAEQVSPAVERHDIFKFPVTFSVKNYPTKRVRKYKNATALLKQTQLVLIQEKISIALKESNSPLCLTELKQSIESDHKSILRAIRGLQSIGYIRMVGLKHKMRFYALYDWKEAQNVR